MLRPDFVRRKLHLVTDDLRLLARYQGVDRDDLVGDPYALAAVERLLERIVMRSVDANAHLLAALARGGEGPSARLSYRDTFLRLVPLGALSPELAGAVAPSAGLRNILVHDYNDVDRVLVHASIALALQTYPRYVDALLRFVDGLAGAPDWPGGAEEV